MKICDAVWTKLTWISSPLFYFSGAEVHLLPYLRDPFYSVRTQSSRMVKQNFLILCLLCSPSPRPAPRPTFSFFLCLLPFLPSFFLWNTAKLKLLLNQGCVFTTLLSPAFLTMQRGLVFFFNVIFLPSKAVLKCSLC